MNIFIWIAQILLALVFAGSGISKLVQPYEKLAARMAYVNDYTPGVIRAIGTLEVLGAIGVVLPVLTGILPWLTPLAALGLSLIQILPLQRYICPKRNITSCRSIWSCCCFPCSSYMGVGSSSNEPRG